MYCGHCGTAASDGASFCQSCGQRLVNPQAPAMLTYAASAPTPPYAPPATAPDYAPPMETLPATSPSFTPLYVPIDTAPLFAGNGPGPAQATAAPRARRPVWKRPRALLAAAVTAVVVGGAVTASVLLTRTPMIDAKGTVLIADTASVSYSEPGDPCDVGDPWSEINEGTSVRITDDDGTTIGRASLGTGYRIDDGCQFTFHLRLPAGKHFYKLVVASHPPLLFTEKQVADESEFGEVFGGM